jgi:PilZ domain-containing protein
MGDNGQTGETPGGCSKGSLPKAELGSQKPMGDRAKNRARYNDVQSAARFPIKLPVAVRSQTGARSTETENISANGVMFQVDSDMPVGSMVDFTISLPADVVGSSADVQLDCRGRVVRSFEDGGRRGVGVVIDEYHFERR